MIAKNMTANIRLKVNQLSYRRNNKFLFHNLNFELNPGEILIVEGANGAGKSTLLRLLTGLSTGYSGSIKFKNKELRENIQLLLNDIHFISHANGIKLNLTVEENLVASLSLAMHSSSPTIHPQITTSLEYLQLQSYRNTKAQLLSAGQKRKLALARLLLIPRELWILDEPLTGLDRTSHRFFFECLQNHLIMRGMAIISSHHEFKLNYPSIQTLNLNSCIRI